MCYFVDIFTFVLDFTAFVSSIWSGMFKRASVIDVIVRDMSSHQSPMYYPCPNCIVVLTILLEL